LTGKPTAFVPSNDFKRMACTGNPQTERTKSPISVVGRRLDTLEERALFQSRRQSKRAGQSKANETVNWKLQVT
jgi:hypothetical protein